MKFDYFSLKTIRVKKPYRAATSFPPKPYQLDRPTLVRWWLCICDGLGRSMLLLPDGLQSLYRWSFHLIWFLSLITSRQILVPCSVDVECRQQRWLWRHCWRFYNGNNIVDVNWVIGGLGALETQIVLSLLGWFSQGFSGGFKVGAGEIFVTAVVVIVGGLHSAAKAESRWCYWAWARAKYCGYWAEVSISFFSFL